MKHWNIDQNSDEWYRARAGIPTASGFNKIITKTGKLSTQVTKYAYQCVAEIFMQRPYEVNFSNDAIEWGNMHEPQAIACYEMLTNYDVRRGGFFTDDDIKYGCSPDARIYEGDKLVGLAEIKCPYDWAKHIEFVLMNEANPEHIPQIQGQMLVTGCEWVDWFSYHPDMPHAKVRIFRDEAFIDKLREELIKFDHLIQHGIDTLRDRGFNIEKPIKTMEFLAKPKHIDVSISQAVQAPITQQ